MIPRTVDRSIARMVATKRLITGSVSIALGIGLVALAVTDDHPINPRLGIAVFIFLFVGGWALRDGIRLRRDLRESQ